MGDTHAGTAPIQRFDGALLREEGALRGFVEHVFRTAAVVRADPGGRLLTLLEARRAVVPWSVAWPAQLPWPRSGDPVRLTGGALVVRSRGISARLEGPGIDLRLASSPGDRAVLRRQLGALTVPERTRGLVEATSALSTVSGLAMRRAAAAAARLADHLAGVDGVAWRPAVGELVGLGPGASPTGDDMLVGMTAAAHRFATPGWVAGARLDTWCQVLRALPPGSTTDVGREMIGHSAGGGFPEPLARLAEGLGSAGPETLRAAATALVAVGATSGADMLAGALTLAQRVASGDGGLER